MPSRRRDAPSHRAATPRRRPAPWVLASVGVLVVLVGVTTGAALLGRDRAPAGSAPTDSAPRARATATAADTKPVQVLAWGPTTDEVDEARALVAEWSADQLAGQVIVGRYHGTDPEEAGAMVRELHLAGVCVTSDNVLDTDQVLATTEAVSAAVAADGRDFPAVIGADQEGGLVAHLRGVATDFPAFAAAGAAVAADGARVVSDAARTTALEMRSLGFTWVFAPVADVTIGAADPTIGTRSPSTDPVLAAEATAAAVQGYDAAGLVSTTKHFPGHGSATADSHDVMPRLDVPLDQLEARDLAPFRAAVAAHAPAVMVSHLDVTALAPGAPASLSAEIYEFLREELGFEGVAVTDSLGMGAVVGREQPAVTALNAGADLLLMPPDTTNTHAVVAAAIESGEVSRERAEEAAARVVALQLWQQRVARGVPVPDDVTERAQQAAAALEAAAGG
jgi:beta-N-acetylhexosaminidase